jgi:hypothetical protein
METTTHASDPALTMQVVNQLCVAYTATRVNDALLTQKSGGQRCGF